MVFHQDEEHRVDGAGAGAGTRQRGRGGRTRRRCRGCLRGRGGAGGGRGGGRLHGGGRGGRGRRRGLSRRARRGRDGGARGRGGGRLAGGGRGDRGRRRILSRRGTSGGGRRRSRGGGRRLSRGCGRTRGGGGGRTARGAGGRGGDIAGGCRGALICYTHAASADLAWTAADAAVTLLASGDVQYAVSAYRKAGGEVPPKFQLAGNQGARHDRARVVNRCPQAYFALKAGTAFPPGSDLRPRLRQPNFDGNGSAGSAYRNRRSTDYDRFVG